MKSHLRCRLAAATLCAIAAFSSAQLLRAQTESQYRFQILLQASADAVRIAQAAMPAYDRSDLSNPPHAVVVLEYEDHYQVVFSPIDPLVRGNLLTVMLNKQSLEVVRVILPGEQK
jgi:hypothetical protein